MSLPVAASASDAGNCALYARDVTGIRLAGNAGTWWGHAAGRYPRGQQPAVGAVLVFKPSGAMRAGHVAVVSRIVNRREIMVDQANWIRGRIVKDTAVFDASPANDWTAVRVADIRTTSWGRINPAFGFIYPDHAPAVIAADWPHVRDQAHPTRLPVRLAVMETTREGPRHTGHVLRDRRADAKAAVHTDHMADRKADRRADRLVADHTARSHRHREIAAAHRMRLPPVPDLKLTLRD